MSKDLLGEFFIIPFEFLIIEVLDSFLELHLCCAFKHPRELYEALLDEKQDFQGIPHEYLKVESVEHLFPCHTVVSKGFNYLETRGLIVRLVVLRNDIFDTHFDADGLFFGIGIL